MKSLQVDDSFKKALSYALRGVQKRPFALTLRILSTERVRQSGNF